MSIGNLVTVRIGNICHIIVNIVIRSINITLESVVSKVRTGGRFKVSLRGKLVGRKVGLITNRSTKGLSINWSGKIEDCRPSMSGRSTVRRIGRVPRGKDGQRFLSCSGRKGKLWLKDKPSTSIRGRQGT